MGTHCCTRMPWEELEGFIPLSLQRRSVTYTMGMMPSVLLTGMLFLTESRSCSGTKFGIGKFPNVTISNTSIERSGCTSNTVENVVENKRVQL